MIKIKQNKNDKNKTKKNVFSFFGFYYQWVYLIQRKIDFDLDSIVINSHSNKLANQTTFSQTFTNLQSNLCRW